MSRQLTAIALAVALTVLIVFAVAGHSALSGPLLFGISKTHGVHRDDLVALEAWIGGLWFAWRLSRH